MAFDAFIVAAIVAQFTQFPPDSLQATAFVALCAQFITINLQH